MRSSREGCGGRCPGLKYPLGRGRWHELPGRCGSLVGGCRGPEEAPPAALGSHCHGSASPSRLVASRMDPIAWPRDADQGRCRQRIAAGVGCAAGTGRTGACLHGRFEEFQSQARRRHAAPEGARATPQHISQSYLVCSTKKFRHPQARNQKSKAKECPCGSPFNNQVCFRYSWAPQEILQLRRIHPHGSNEIT